MKENLYFKVRRPLEEAENKHSNSDELFQRHKPRDRKNISPLKKPLFSESAEFLKAETKGILDRISNILEDMDDDEREKTISFLKNWLMMGNLDVVTNALGYSKDNIAKKASQLEKIEKKIKDKQSENSILDEKIQVTNNTIREKEHYIKYLMNRINDEHIERITKCKEKRDLDSKKIQEAQEKITLLDEELKMLSAAKTKEADISKFLDKENFYIEKLIKTMKQAAQM